MKKKKLIAVGSFALSTILLLNGCNNNTISNETTSFVYTDDDINNYITDDKLSINHWYVIETFDGENKELKLTKKSSFDKINNDLYQYYYTDVIKEDYKVYAVIYNHLEKKFWVETGPEIISAVPFTDYLDKYNLRKPSYSKEEIINIFDMIKEEYYNKKELEGKGKVLIKDNYFY